MRLKFFQEVGREFLAKRSRALLADEMRLGKTPQALAAAAKVQAANKQPIFRVLVICPAVAKLVWEYEQPRWAPQLTGCMTVVSYDYARANTDKLTQHRWDVLILDECHYLKSPDAKRTQFILGKDGIGWQADKIWALSGTPAPNHVGELWPLLKSCGITNAGYQDFINAYCYCDKDGKPRGTKAKAVPRIKRMLDGFMLRRRKADVAPELPKCSITPWPVDSSREFLGLVRPVDGGKLLAEAEALQVQLKTALAQVPAEDHGEFLQEHITEFATLRRVTGILKAPAVYNSIVFEVQNGLLDKLVVFAYHREPMILLHRLLNEEAGIKAEILYGGTPEKKRDALLKRFNKPNNKGGSAVLVANILTAGTAIDLSVAHQGILLERDWVPGNNLQALERLGGHNQTNPITFRDAILPGSVDEIVGDVVRRKTDELQQIFG